MSLETFIGRDLLVMEHNIQPVETEQNEDNENEQFPSTERITTEDILGTKTIFFIKSYIFIFYWIGNISESDTSDDDENDTKQSSSLPVSQNQQDASDDLLTNETSSPKHRHHKHSKKRLKTSHSHATSTDAAALQLSEDEL